MQKQISKKSFEDATAPPFDRVAMEDEISLVDLWFVVRRDRWWLLAGLLIGVAVAIAYATLSTPVYESRASIQIGNVPSPAQNAPLLIEDPNVLSVELIDEYGPKSINGNARTPYLEKKELKVRNNILDLAAVGHRPEAPRDLLTQIVAKILQQHQRSYANAIEPLRQRSVAIDRQIGILTTQMKELGDLVTRLKDSNPVQASLVAIERGHLYANLDQLERDRVVVQQQTTTPYVNPTQVIAKPEVQKGPVSPRKIVALVVGIVLGLLVGLLAIFLKQFAANVQRASESDNPRST
jgi:Chain length determinant protein